MDNAQVMARDGSWFLFADWQGLTRIGVPGDKIKTDANLDRPNEHRPLVERPSGMVWSAYALDVDPVALKKVKQDPYGHDSPDPLGGPEIAVGHAGGSVSIRGVKLALVAAGDEVWLGSTPGRRDEYTEVRYGLYPDDTVVVFGCVSTPVAARAGAPAHTSWRPQVGLVTRAPDGTGRVAWCRPVARLENSSPDAFRDRGRTWLADRDIVAGVAYLVEVADDGEVVSEAQASAVAGPWVFAGQVWWQSDEATLCVGDRLGAPTRSFTLAPEHAGPGELLRVAGRMLFLSWHRGTIVDLAPAKRGKGELSRKHRAAEAPMYLEAERALRPIRAGMARRNVRVEWRGCVRHGKRLQPTVAITGKADLVTYILAYSLQDGMAARLANVGVGSVSFSGGVSYDSIFAQAEPTREQDIHDLMAMLDAAGISRTAGLGYLGSLRTTATQRGTSLPFTPGAEGLLAAMLASGGGDVAQAPVVEQVQEAGGGPTLEEARVCAELEGVLSREFGLAPAQCREGVGWYRFAIEGVAFQGGLHDDLRVFATLCRTDTDVNMKKLMASIRAASEGLVDVRFDEADGYIQVRAACGLSEVSAARVKSMIEACRAAIGSEAGAGLRAKYRSYE